MDEGRLGPWVLSFIEEATGQSEAAAMASMATAFKAMGHGGSRSQGGRLVGSVQRASVELGRR